MDQSIKSAFEQLLTLAESSQGATSPNPPVGAAALSKDGRILSVQAHQKAGLEHAEALVLRDLANRELLNEAHTLLVSLEPCNHQGRTPPCSQAIIRAYQDRGAFQKVIFICKDQNPNVNGSGAAKLRASGIEVRCLEEARDTSSAIVERGQRLVRSFFHWSKTGKPWLTLKIAVNLRGSMIPEKGLKTFTQDSSLELAHHLRRRADAILTGSGTILADQPLFTVRRVADHPLTKKRWLVILDRRRLVSQNYLKTAESHGFQVSIQSDLNQALQFLGAHGCLEVLVEAGPTLSQAILEAGVWNEQVLIRQVSENRDRIEVTLKKS